MIAHFKSRADIASNICSFFIVFQATKLRRKTIEKLYAAKKKDATNKMSGFRLIHKIIYRPSTK